MTPRLLALFLSLGLALAHAQEKGTPSADVDVDRQRAEEQVRQMRNLNLSDAQRRQLVDGLARQSWRQRRDGALRKVDLQPATMRSLGLSGEQREQVEKVLDDVGRRLFRRFAESKSGTAKWSMADWRAYLMTLRSETDARIGKLLTDDQRARWEVIAAKQAEAAKQAYARWGQMDGSVKGGKGKGKGDTKGDRKKTAAAKSPETADDEIARLLKAALKALALSAEEATAIRPSLEALIRHKVTGRRALSRRRARMVRAKADSDGLLEQYRARRKAYRETLAELEKAVRELLTLQQETRLVGLDILS